MTSHSPHPLALALIDALGRKAARVLDVGTGSGRNAAALRAAGHQTDAITDAAINTGLAAQRGAGYDAIISTHAFLHGTANDAARNVREARAALRDGGLFYATFASIRDARYGRGSKLDEQSFAPVDGDEAGVPHVYFSEDTLRALLEPHFAIDSVEENGVDTVVGRWAHAQQPSGSVHWFVRARAKVQ